MKTIEQLDKEMANLEKKLSEVKGTSTEVYTRIVGYHRAVDNWNKGKKEEYLDRVTFNAKEKTIQDKLDVDIFKEAYKKDMIENTDANDKSEQKEANSIDKKEITYYKYFQSEFCVNCPPVGKYLANIDLKGEKLDVSTDLGLGIAREYNIMSTPAVLFFNDKDKVVAKASSVIELQDLLEQKEKTAV